VVDDSNMWWDVVYDDLRGARGYKGFGCSNCIDFETADEWHGSSRGRVSIMI
jgi:hypothetical protein